MEESGFELKKDGRFPIDLYTHTCIYIYLKRHVGTAAPVANLVDLNSYLLAKFLDPGSTPGGCVFLL